MAKFSLKKYLASIELIRNFCIIKNNVTRKYKDYETVFCKR